MDFSVFIRNFTVNYSSQFCYPSVCCRERREDSLQFTCSLSSASSNRSFGHLSMSVHFGGISCRKRLQKPPPVSKISTLNPEAEPFFPTSVQENVWRLGESCEVFHKSMTNCSDALKLSTSSILTIGKLPFTEADMMVPLMMKSEICRLLLYPD